ncbi:MAG: hypothetical protein KF819_09675 [Labilithrix sp.]|nr:hypothetical protein [Labilithrix sp.]
MKLRVFARLLLLASPFGVFAVASCATAEEAIGPPDPGATLPGQQEAGSDAGAVVPDGGCDGSDDDCVTEAISCDVAAWCPVATNVSSRYALTSVWGAAPNDVWAAGSGGTLIHWDGATWKPTATGVRNTFYAVGGSAANDVWAVSSTDVIFHFDGSKWALAPRATQNDWESAPLFALRADGAGNVRVGGRWTTLREPNGDTRQGNQFVKTTLDGGVAWAGVRGTFTVHGIWGASADDLWLVGDNSEWVSWQLGVTMHGTRAGGAAEHTWTEVDSQSSVLLEAVWGSSANDVWAVGDNGTIRRFVAGATEWAIVPAPTREALHAVWGASASDVWAVGESGTILHFDGTTWSPSVAAFPVNKKRPHLYGVWGSSANDVWIVGDGIALRHGGPK